MLMVLLRLILLVVQWNRYNKGSFRALQWPIFCQALLFHHSGQWMWDFTWKSIWVRYRDSVLKLDSGFKSNLDARKLNKEGEMH